MIDLSMTSFMCFSVSGISFFIAVWLVRKGKSTYKRKKTKLAMIEEVLLIHTDEIIQVEP